MKMINSVASVAQQSKKDSVCALQTSTHNPQIMTSMTNILKRIIVVPAVSAAQRLMAGIGHAMATAHGTVQ